MRKASFVRLLSIFLLALTFAAGGCAVFISTPRIAYALTDADKARLQAEYDKLQKEIEQLNQTLNGLNAQKNTYQGDISILNAQIKKAEAEIKQRNNTITELADEIHQKAAHISDLEERIENGRESLAKLIREKNESESRPLAMLLLTAGDFSSFFSDVDQIDSINRDLQSLFAELRDNRTETQKEQDALDARKSQELDAKYVVETKKKQVDTAKVEKQQLLNITQNQETEYQKVLADRQAKAAQIRAALFPLRDAAAINFGDALDYAQAAKKTTGVDPALVLAILTQESNLGANVGQCYLTNNMTGSGIGKNTGRVFVNVMSPTRDVPPFLALSKSLGFDPHQQVVSCPIAGVGGWGGAMGPAQFIASTWAGLESRIASARGVSVANPWDPGDAIMAMSIYLGNLGAGAGGYSAEHTAAAKYYAGGGWATVGQTYANQVMAKVADIQKNIDFLTDI